MIMIMINYGETKILLEVTSKEFLNLVDFWK